VLQLGKVLPRKKESFLLSQTPFVAVPVLSFFFNLCHSQKKSSEMAWRVQSLPDTQNKGVVIL